MTILCEWGEHACPGSRSRPANASREAHQSDDRRRFGGRAGPCLDWIEEEPGLEVVARHANGKLGVEDVARSAPDIVLLDIEMPVMDSWLAADGDLVLGAAETAIGLSNEFTAVPENHHGHVPFHA
jgi:hypothetical protein